MTDWPCPGVPLVWHVTFKRIAKKGVTEQLRFLVSVHKVQRVVLIAHEGCHFYSERLHVSPLQLETQQRDDISKAIRRVRQFGFDLEVAAFFARLDGAAVARPDPGMTIRPEAALRPRSRPGPFKWADRPRSEWGGDAAATSE